METQKAGCFLVDLKTKQVCLIYRDHHDDYTFPKGHIEAGEDAKTAALRETAEETKRDAIIVEDFAPYEEHYTTPSGENCVCYMFIAIDNGKSDNNSTDTHDVVWTPFDKVEETLSYPSLKKSWNAVKDNILNLFNKKDEI